jgi:hypothetical protein
MGLSKVFQNKKKQKRQELFRLADYLNQKMSTYFEYANFIHKENSKVEKKLSEQYQLLQKKFVFQKMAQFEIVNKHATVAQKQSFENGCFRKLELAYKQTKEKFCTEYIEANKQKIEFIKHYDEKLKEYTKLQTELKEENLLKKYEPLPIVENSEPTI